MKKIIVLLFGVVAVGQVFAQTAVCTNGRAANNGVYTSTNTTANPAFVVRDFPTRCSANITATARENAIAFAVGAISTKGKSFFQGNSGGGAIRAQACTGATGTCVAGQEDTGLQTLLNAAT